MPDTSFDDLFSRCAFAAMDRQLHLAEVHGGQDWAADLEKAEMRFAGTTTYRMQLLGSESEVSDTWLWASANEMSDLPRGVLQAAHRLRELGEQLGIVELTSPQFDLDRASGHELAMIATELLDGVAYYRGPYDEGAAFFLLTSPPLPPDTRTLANRAMDAVTRILETFEVVAPREGLRRLAQRLGMTLNTRDECRWQMSDGAVAMLTFTFDDKGRLTGVDSMQSATGR